MFSDEDENFLGLMEMGEIPMGLLSNAVMGEGSPRHPPASPSPPLSPRRMPLIMNDLPGPGLSDDPNQRRFVSDDDFFPSPVVPEVADVGVSASPAVFPQVGASSPPAPPLVSSVSSPLAPPRGVSSPSVGSASSVRLRGGASHATKRQKAADEEEVLASGGPSRRRRTGTSSAPQAQAAPVALRDRVAPRSATVRRSTRQTAAVGAAPPAGPVGEADDVPNIVIRQPDATNPFDHGERLTIPPQMLFIEARVDNFAQMKQGEQHVMDVSRAPVTKEQYDHFNRVGAKLDAIDEDLNQIEGYNPATRRLEPVRGGKLAVNVQRNELIAIYRGDEFKNMEVFDAELERDERRSGHYAISIQPEGGVRRVFDASYHPWGARLVNHCSIHDTRRYGYLPNVHAVELQQNGRTFAVGFVALMDMAAGTPLFLDYGEALVVNEERRSWMAALQIYYGLKEAGLDVGQHRRSDLISSRNNIWRVLGVLYPGEYMAPHFGRANSSVFRIMQDEEMDAYLGYKSPYIELRTTNPKEHAKLFWKIAYGPKSTRLSRKVKLQVRAGVLWKSPILINPATKLAYVNPDFVEPEGYVPYTTFHA